MNKKSRSKEMDPNYILPKIKEVHVHYRSDLDQYLVINPIGPNWFITNKYGLSLIKLCDGETSIHEILNLLDRTGMIVNPEDVLKFFSFLNGIHFFDEGEEKAVNLLDSVFLNITSKCNLNCVYCYYDANNSENDNKEEIPADLWVKIIQQINEINPHCVVIISGGEPLLSKNFYPVLDTLEKLGMKTRIYTNGVLVNQNTAQKLKEYRCIDYVQVSLDSVVKEENIKTRTINPAKTMQSILELKSQGVPVHVSSTITNINSRSIPQLVDFFRENELKYRFVLYFPTPGRAIKNMGLYRADDSTLTYISKNVKINDPLNINIIKGYKRLVKRTTCGYSKVLSISELGLVYPCNHLYLDQFVMGDAKKEKLQDIISKSQGSFHPIPIDTFEECKDCELRYICGGTCRATAFHEKGKLNARSSECSFNKETILNVLWEQSLMQSENGLSDGSLKCS